MMDVNLFYTVGASPLLFFINLMEYCVVLKKNGVVLSVILVVFFLRNIFFIFKK